MAIERHMIFVNAKAYNIQLTIAALADVTLELFSESDAVVMQTLRACSKLTDIKWDERVNFEDFICDVDTGEEIGMAEWFEKYGVEAPYPHYSMFVDESGDELMVSSVGTFSMDDNGFSLDDEEAITDEFEVEICIGVHILMELSREDGENVGSF